MQPSSISLCGMDGRLDGWKPVCIGSREQGPVSHHRVPRCFSDVHLDPVDRGKAVNLPFL